MCDMSQKSRASSTKAVTNFPEGEKATDAKCDSTKIQVKFGMKAVTSEMRTREKTFPEVKFGGSKQIYRSHSSELISTVDFDKNQIKKIIVFENLIIISKFNQ